MRASCIELFIGFSNIIFHEVYVETTIRGNMHLFLRLCYISHNKIPFHFYDILAHETRTPFLLPVGIPFFLQKIK